jgi:hypothetical protein
MSDVNSQLPIRTETAGQVNSEDLVAKIGDGTTPTQLLGVDAAGLIGSKLFDGAGTAVTSQASGAQQALDVGINVAGVQVDPRAIRALTNADVVTVEQGAASNAAGGWFVRPTDGTNSQAYLAGGEAKVSVTQALPAGANNIGSVNQGTSPWITKDQSDGPVAPGAVASFSQLMGGQYNSALPTLTNTQQSAIQLDSSGRIIIAPLTNASIVKAQLQDNAGTAIVLGQTTMSASVPVVIASDQTAIPVSITAGAGDKINNYNTASAVAAAASSNHDYTVTALKTLSLMQIEASASGKMKIEVKIEDSPGAGTFTSRFVKFNSTANPNISIHIDAPEDVAAGVKVRIVRTNLDNQAQDLYTTITGIES